MKYKGITLFSAALILMGSVGTATGYIADHPTEVSAAGVDTSSISSLLNSLSSLLGAGTTAKSEAVSSSNDNSAADIQTQTVNYEVLDHSNTDEDVPPMAGAGFFTNESVITKNSDGGFDVQVIVTGTGVSKITVTKINGVAPIKIDPSNGGNTLQTHFEIDKLDDLKNSRVPYTINMGGKFEQTVDLKYDADGITSAEKVFQNDDTNNDKNSTDDKVTELQNNLDGISDQKDALETANEKLDQSIADLQTKLAQLKKDSADSPAAQKIITDVSDQISKLQNNKKEIDGLISQLKTKIDTIKTDLKNAKGAKDAVKEAEIEKIQTAIDSAKTVKNNIDSKVDTLKSGIKALATTIQQKIADANATKPLDVDDETDSDASDKITGEYKVPYVVDKTGTNTASLSSQYFTKTAFVTKNTDGSGFTVEVQMQYQKAFTEDGVKITAVNGKALDQSTVTTTSDDNNYLKSFKFNIGDLSELNSAIPVKMDLNIPNAITATESADLVFDTSKLPITDPKNNGNGQVLGSGNNTGTGTPSTPTNTSTSGATGSSTGTLPQTDAKGLPVYIMYAGFIILAVTLAGAGKVKFTGKK